MNSDVKFKYESRPQTKLCIDGAEPIRKVMYRHISMEELRKEFHQKNTGHPRVLATSGDFEDIIARIKTDARTKKFFDEVVREAEELLQTQPPQTPERHLSTERLKNFCLVYRLTKEERFANRAWQEMERMCSFQTWSPTEKLDMGYILKGMAIGYDWLFDFLSCEQREIVRTAILDKALLPERKVYQNPYEEGVDAHYILQNTNHNVSINCGLMMAAAALFDECEEVCSEIIESALWALENYLPEFLEYGAGKEGVYYWYWPMESTNEIMGTLRATFGTDYGISCTSGIEKTGYFPIYMTGATGMAFNWGNGLPQMYISADLFHLAKILNKPELCKLRLKAMEKYDITAKAYDLLWYSPCGYDLSELPKDGYFQRTESVGMCSDWDNKNALSVCFKGGFNSEVHGSLNTGSFVLDALGERWAWLIGQESYDVPGYWDYSENGQRWTYYRMRAEGQNAMVLNPSNHPDQYPLAYSKIEKFESKPHASFAIIDATPAFSNDETVASAKRGFYMLDNRQKIMIQDEIQAQNADYWWFMQTKATIEIVADGKTAVLEQNGKKMMVFLRSNVPAGFQVLDAKPLPMCPNPPENSPNDEVKKLTVHIPKANDITVSLVFVPLTDRIDIGRIPTLKTMDTWHIL
ncbi:MAG: DUF4962 domain-containing protein [Clostridia bacterium]|nr:DUF4962 domain-containing protein [Clostridia bacterium]